MTNPVTNKNANHAIRETEKSFQYWKHKLAGAHRRIEFQIDLPKPGASMNKTAVFNFTISKFSGRALSLVADQYDVSLSIILLSAFNTLLYRYTNQTDILIGYCSVDYSNNDGRLTESLGNIVPLRTDLSKDLSFIELLYSTRHVADNANSYGNVPREMFEEALCLQEGEKNGSLFQVLFAFQNAGEPGIKDHVFSLNYQGGADQTVGADLILSVKNNPDGSEGALEYNSAMFGSDTIEQMAAHYQILLDGVVANPEQKIAQIPILSETERNRIIVDWNNTDASYPEDKCIHELFEKQVRLSPDAVAAILYSNAGTSFSQNKGQLTYSELNKKANQLAHYLRSLGVGPEVLVGIYMKRSFDMVVALLGILKAGGAYLPLDPSHPKDRLKFMLEDSRISILLSQNQLLDKLPPNDLQVVCLDTQRQKIALFNHTNPLSQVHPENLAYVIYTSGSTGRPKGTLILHKGVVNYLSWCIKTYKVADGNGCPVNSSLGFDATVTSFLSPLLVGKQLILLPEDGEVEALGNVLRSGINYSLVKITPAHLEILSNLLPFNEIDINVNALIIGGEALTATSLVHWRKFAPSTRLINEYGPTETVVGCCVYEISEEDPFSGNVPIGRPIANTQIYILDKYLKPVPVGVPGEIYIGGAGLARGYLNRPELTKERFIPNPFSAEINARLYKTGDVARFLPNGNIVFLGRSDYQVKIRGYRIDLGEIESALAQCLEVQQCTVMVREDFPGDKRLVAYLVCKQGHTISTKNLKRFLGEKLPEYMVPSAIVELDILPLTTNGKVDRAALPVPDLDRHDIARDFTPARDKVEIELTKLFEKVLRINHIGVQDNVFELGLHSMQAYALFAHIKKSFGIQLPLSILFQAPTIEQLAIYLKGKDADIPWSSLVPIQPNGSKLPLFLIHAGAGTVLFYRELSNHLGTDQPVYGLQPKGLDGKQKFHKSIEEMATHYVKEIRTVNAEGPYFIGGYCFGAVVAFEMAQQLIAQGCEVGLIANFNGVSPTYVYGPHNDAVDDYREDGGPNEDQEIPVVYSKPAPVVYPRFSWKALAQKSTKEKYTFLAGRINNRILNPFFGMMKYYYVITVMWIYKYYHALGLKSWEPLRKYFFLGYNSEMVKAYKPKPYPGRMTIFRSPAIYKDAHLGWSDFVKGEIKTLDIPGYHKDRREIMNEPFVQATAKALRKHIEECLNHD